MRTRTTGAWREPTPPSSKLRWLFLWVSVLLLALLLVSGVLAVRFLSEMRTQELAATRALAERTRALSGLWLSIQSYDQAVQQFVAQTAADRDAEARRRLDQLTLEIDADFDRYPSVRDSEEDALLNGMRGVFSQQRTLYITILAAQARGTQAPGGKHACRAPRARPEADPGLVRETPGVERRAAPACRSRAA